jgi:toxin ParE1/3/4
LAQVVWSEQAIDQLADACQFIARSSPRYAEIFAQRVSRAVDSLKQFPLSGRVILEVGNRLVREIAAQNYRVMYPLVGDQVQILFVHHGARRFPKVDQFEP